MRYARMMWVAYCMLHWACLVDEEPMLGNSAASQVASLDVSVPLTGTTRCPILDRECMDKQEGKRTMVHSTQLVLPFLLAAGDVSPEGPALWGNRWRVALNSWQLSRLAPTVSVYPSGSARAGELIVQLDRYDDAYWQLSLVLRFDDLSYKGERSGSFEMNGSTLIEKGVDLSLATLASQLGCNELITRNGFYQCISSM